MIETMIPVIALVASIFCVVAAVFCTSYRLMQRPPSRNDPDRLKRDR